MKIESSVWMCHVWNKEDQRKRKWGGAEEAGDIQAVNDHKIGVLEGPWKGLRECRRRCREVWG